MIVQRQMTAEVKAKDGLTSVHFDNLEDDELFCLLLVFKERQTAFGALVYGALRAEAIRAGHFEPGLP